MNSKENFNEIVAYDFSNLNLGQNDSDNCYNINACVCDAGCDSGDCDCNDCYCDSNW
jgi:hypothetical protein